MLFAFDKQEKSPTRQLLFAAGVCQRCSSSARRAALPAPRCVFHQAFPDIETIKVIRSSLRGSQDYEKTWEHFTSSTVAKPLWSQRGWDAHRVKRAWESLVFPDKPLNFHLLLLFNVETMAKQTWLEGTNMEMAFGTVQKRLTLCP